jgi:ABC-type transporter Mla subunit MlaD
MIEILNQNINLISYGLAIFILISPILLKSKFGKSHIAGLTITIGIFGTFFGVFIGLLNFNPDNITASVPKLINGLQTAFATSIAGLLANLILRIHPNLYGFKQELIGKKSDDIAEQMIESLNRVANSISGDGESTIVTQLQKIRTTNSDGFDKMNKSFEDFAEKMIADNTQSLIDALTQVMQDFNTKINEQFGENFKQLNEAVGAMLEWQREYKKHVETLTSQFSAISINIKQIDSALKSTAKSNNTIFETNEVLREVVSDFSSTVKSFAELGDKAKNSFPIIEQNMNSLTESSNQYVRDSLADIHTNYDSFSNTQKLLMENYKANIEKMIADNADRIKNLDNELGQELNKALESLGSQLTSLSQHFVNDYKPLTEKLKELVQMANRIN